MDYNRDQIRKAVKAHNVSMESEFSDHGRFPKAAVMLGYGENDMVVFVLDHTLGLDRILQTLENALVVLRDIGMREGLGPASGGLN